MLNPAIVMKAKKGKELVEDEDRTSGSLVELDDEHNEVVASKGAIESASGWPVRVHFTWKKLVLLLTCIVGLDCLYLLVKLPSIFSLSSGNVPASAIMRDFEADHPQVKLRWRPLSKNLPKRVSRAFIVAEDSRFYSHSGIDVLAIRDAIRFNLNGNRVFLGASTISQQTAKNMFLSLSNINFAYSIFDKKCFY